MNDFNSLKNNILNTAKRNKTNKKPKSQLSSTKSPPKTKQAQLRNGRTKYQVVFNALKAKSSNEWYSYFKRNTKIKKWPLLIEKNYYF